MKPFNLPIHSNPLKTRNDIENALLQMLEPLKGLYSEGRAGLHLGNTGAHYGENPARMEAFSRPLWGLAPFWVGRGHPEFLEIYRTGLINGADPEHPEYWGEVYDYDQKMVEMAAIAFALSLHLDKFDFSEREKRNIHAWLNQINSYRPHPNNWLFFRVLVNAMFKRSGWHYDANNLENDLETIDSFYMSGGWYCDGSPARVDYYVPFALHYYGLLYSVIMKELDPQRSAIFKHRAAEFAPDFLYWFDDKGKAVPFGRSQTYRFGQSAFFAAMAYAEVDALPWGVLKSRVLGNLRDWMKKPVFSDSGILTIGYGYPNLFMSESYNAPGSPYWGLKTFLCLAMDKNHPFWTSEEIIPELDEKKLLSQPKMIITRDSTQVQMFVSGQHYSQRGQSQAKYEKLVYSSVFGFSVPRGNTLEEGAFDNCLAVSEAGEDDYRAQYGFEETVTTEEYTYRKYTIRKGVSVETKVIPSFPLHTRIHTITTDRIIDIADGGFAIASETGLERFAPDMVEITENSITARFSWGVSGIKCESHICTPSLIKAMPNTNLFNPNTVIPTIKITLQPGTHVITTVVTGYCPPCK